MRVNVRIIEDCASRARQAGIARLAKPSPEPDRSRFTGPAQRRARLTEFTAELGDSRSAQLALERVLGGNDLVGINYLERGMLAARSVGRVHLRDADGRTSGFGTGFLVAPGVLMTNHHVIGSAEEARGATVEFEYEIDAYDQKRTEVAFELHTAVTPITHQGLDFCLVAVADRSQAGHRSRADYGWLPLSPTPGKAFVGEYLTIIQHPGGERKQVCVRENKLLKFDEGGSTLWYQTDTVAGSSGSPVFNNAWQVVALHHSGIPRTDRNGRWLTVDGTPWDASMDESRIAWTANEGIRVSSILAYLQANHARHPLAEAVLARPSPPRPNPGRERAEMGASHSRDGELCVTVPVRIAVRVGAECDAIRGLGPSGGGGRDAGGLAGTPKTPGPRPTGPITGGVEAVVIDQNTYDQRPGYRPTFLGEAALRIPLPTLKDPARRKLLVPVKGQPRGELKYWNYSVLLHKARKLAFLSAVNVDASQRPETAGREGDRWYVDTRVDARLQLDQSFYGSQRSFEAKLDRTLNPFDRGHLTRRLDAQWGRDDSLATRNGNDSFHFTNCAPQHWRFNQGAKRWLGLEDHVVSRFAGGQRASVFNGPVFDAPVSKMSPDGRLRPSLLGASHKDPTFGGIAIPKLYFKIVACARGNQTLGVAAFLMSQEDLLRTVGRRLKGLPPAPNEALTDDEARLYQVRVRDIERITGLDFGPLAGSDTLAEEAMVAGMPVEVESLESIRL